MNLKAKLAAATSAMKKKTKGKVPKGYHTMPDGTVMKDSAHKNK